MSRALIPPPGSVLTREMAEAIARRNAWRLYGRAAWVVAKHAAGWAVFLYFVFS